jgi:hypothetical protein
MKANVRTLSALVALLAIVVVAFSAAVPVALADRGGNQIRIASVTLSGDNTNLIIVVSAKVKDPTVTAVSFDLSVSYGDHHLNAHQQGTLVATSSKGGGVDDKYTEVTFVVPYQGPGYYFIRVDASNPANGALLGSAWVDPREGTAG